MPVHGAGAGLPGRVAGRSELRPGIREASWATHWVRSGSEWPPSSLDSQPPGNLEGLPTVESSMPEASQVPGLGRTPGLQLTG